MITIGFRNSPGGLSSRPDTAKSKLEEIHSKLLTETKR